MNLSRRVVVTAPMMFYWCWKKDDHTFISPAAFAVEV